MAELFRETWAGLSNGEDVAGSPNTDLTWFALANNFEGVGDGSGLVQGVAGGATWNSIVPVEASAEHRPRVWIEIGVAALGTTGGSAIDLSVNNSSDPERTAGIGAYVQGDGVVYVYDSNGVEIGQRTPGVWPYDLPFVMRVEVDLPRVRVRIGDHVWAEGESQIVWNPALDTVAAVAALRTIGDHHDGEWAIGTLAVPGAPTGVAAASGTIPGSVDVTWVAPTDTGDTLLDRYIVQTSPAGASDWTSHPTEGTAATISGLTPGADYDLRVLAENWVGDSDPSGSVTVTAGTGAGRSMMRLFRKASAICC